MTDTPRTDNAAGDGTTVPADFAADLECELNAMTDERDRAEHETGKAYIERDEARAELARLALLPPQRPLWEKGCPVCGIGSKPGVYGVVCVRGDCPTRVTCGVAK
jgi:hypothetical protein